MPADVDPCGGLRRRWGRLSMVRAVGTGSRHSQHAHPHLVRRLDQRVSRLADGPLADEPLHRGDTRGQGGVEEAAKILRRAALGRRRVRRSSPEARYGPRDPAGPCSHQQARPRLRCCRPRDPVTPDGQRLRPRPVRIGREDAAVQQNQIGRRRGARDADRGPGEHGEAADAYPPRGSGMATRASTSSRTPNEIRGRPTPVSHLPSGCRRAIP